MPTSRSHLRRKDSLSVPVAQPRLLSALSLCLGQIVSLLGSGLTSFALGVSVFRETGSAIDLGLLTVAATLPGVVVAPVAGILVDRFGRRSMMILSDSGAILGTVALLLLLATGKLRLAYLFLIVGNGSVFNALQYPAFSAALAALAPDRHLSRINGVVEFGVAGVQTTAPVMGAFLLELGGLGGVITFDLVTFCFSIAVLSLLRVPRVEGAPERPEPLPRKLTFGWRYIRRHPGLLHLLAFFATLNFLVPMAMLLTTPLVLSIATAKALGTVLSCAALSSVLGGVVMSTSGGPDRKIRGILAAGPMMAAGLIVLGLRPWVPSITAGLSMIFFVLPILNGCSQTIWMRRVEPAVQGRVFATRRMIAQFTSPVAFFVAGPLAEKVFEPLLVPSGALAATPLAVLIGTGAGRGTALLVTILGLVLALACAWAFLDPTLRQVEDPPSLKW